MSRPQRLRPLPVNKFHRTWYRLTSSFWFTPLLIVLVSVALAAMMIEIDAVVPRALLTPWPRVFGAGAEGARGMLSTIAGSMMSIVGVTFSMTLVALSLASSQYSSRVLRSFMKSGVTQVTLGLFVGIFAYCLIVMRTIRGGDEGTFVPALSVFVAVLLALAGVGLLIFFLHHIASSIQASTVIASVADETLSTVDSLFPEDLGDAEDESWNAAADPPPAEWLPIVTQRSGYVEHVDADTLLAVARNSERVVRMELGPGDFAVEATPIGWISGGEPDDEIAKVILQAFHLSRHRTVDQDPAFGIRQLVDIALKALSPGINDTTTAVICLDYLTAILARCALRRIPSLCRYENGELRVIAIGPSFARLVGIALNQIRDSAGGNVVVLMKLLESIERVGRLTRSASRTAALSEQVRRIAEIAGRTVEAPHERARITERIAAANAAFDLKSSATPAPRAG